MIGGRISWRPLSFCCCSRHGHRPLELLFKTRGNGRRKLAPDRTAEIQARLAAMGVKVVLMPNGMLHGLPHQPDGQHLTPEGYHMLAEQLVGQVAAALGH